MSAYDRVVKSTRQRWKTHSATCFAWPSTVEVVTNDSVAEGLGAIVHVESKLPNWRRRIARGANATTTFIAEECTFEYKPGYIYLGKVCVMSGIKRYGHYSYDGDLARNHSDIWVRPSAASTLEDDRVRDEALVRAISDARRKQNHFRGGNFLAELRDTIRGLRNPVKGFRELLDTYGRNARKRVKRATGRRSVPTTRQQFEELQKSNPDVARAASKALSDSWLEANFGWTPLLSDAVDAYQALRALSARVPLARFYGASDREDPPSYTSFVRNHDISAVRFTVRNGKRYFCKVYGAVKLRVDSPSGQAIEEMGVRARDFIPAVWEAIPYSFLIDYFSNVGDVLEAVCFPRSDLAWISRTYVNHSTRSSEQVAVDKYSPTHPANNSNEVFHFVPPRYSWDRKYVVRQKHVSSIIPGHRFEIPGSRNWKKYVNMAALARLRTL